MTKTGTTDATERGEMDSFDRKLLALMQQDNQRTHSAMGDEIGLSASAVRRRLAKLRADGVIERDVALLRQNGMGVRLIVTVTFGHETVEAFDAFDRQIVETPEILQGYHVAGTEDYVLIVHGPNLHWYENWSKQAFMANPAIRRYDTRVVWSCKKFETSIPV